MGGAIVYGRIVEKRELKILREEQVLIAQTEGDLIPAFYVSTNQAFLYEFFGGLQEGHKFRDEIKH